MKEALFLAINANYQFSEDAFAHLKEIAKNKELSEMVKNVIERLNALTEKKYVITRQDLEEAPKKGEQIKTVKKVFRPLAKEIEPDIKILEDPTGQLGSDGDIKSFLSYFQDRYIRLKDLLKQRMDVRDAISIKDALEQKPHTKINIIGIVSEKAERKKTIFLQIEDLESNANVIVPSTVEENVFKKAQELMLDQVICVSAVKGQGDLLIANDIIWPDIPERKMRSAELAVHIALISDLHIGSKEFLKEAFNRFILWLNGKIGNGRQRRLAGRIKYILIAGDLVDGVGVYPEQDKDLEITDVFEQYKMAAKYLAQIPEYITILIIPGNHDATRQALPQPAIPKIYAAPLYELKNVIMLGNPSRIQLHGVEILMYHGRSLDDVISTVPGVSYQTLSSSVPKVMEILLKARHLAPIFGNKTPIAPEDKDHLVINTVPDILHMGHIHVVGYENYRGTLLVNSGACQGQTAFQRKMGLIPVPGIIPVINLKTLHLTNIDFNPK